MIDKGCDYIDNTKLVGKTTAADAIPDSNIVDIGFHYWVYGRLAADLNGDLTVNFKDFAIFANYWWTYFNFNDLQVMADEWLKTLPVEPNLQLEIIGDGNNGLVEFNVSGYSQDTQRVFLLIDGQYAGEIFGFWDGDTLGIDISVLGGGEKQIKVVSINGDRQVTCSNVKITEFACPLNYCFLPNEYEPNKPLYFSAFNPAGGDVTVNAYADDGNVVWSQTYSGDGFFGSIPPEITNQYKFDYISFAPSGGAAISKISDPKEPEPQGSVRALIILSPFDLRWRNFFSTRHVRKAFKNMGIKYVELRGNSANYDTIAFYVATNPIKYMYILAHGQYRLKQPDGTYVLRTHVELNGKRVVSIKKSDPGAPSWCEDLGFWEDPKLTKSFASMGFNFLEFVYSDACYGGRLMINSYGQLVEGRPGAIGQAYDSLISDMSIALGMHKSSWSCRYQGWFEKSRFSLWGTHYQEWTEDEWDALGSGDNLQMAIMYAASHQETSGDPYAPINALRLKGQGLLQEIKLGN